MPESTVNALITGTLAFLGFLCGGGLFGYLTARKKQTSEIKQTEANTDSITVDNQRKRDERYDFLVNRTETDAIARLKLYDEIEALKRKELARIEEAVNFTTRISSLEAIIKKLEMEIARRDAKDKDAASTAKTVADTASTVANTAAAVQAGIDHAANVELLPPHDPAP